MNKKAMAVLPILLITLSLAGFAYAHWSDTVVIEGTVHMGELIVGWYNTTPYNLCWYESTNYYLEENFDVPKPWVCDADIVLSEEETSVHHDPPETVYKKMTITVDNAYPQWDLWIDAWLKNAGTIPAVLCPDFSIWMYDETDTEELDFRIDYYEFDPDPEYGYLYVEGAVVDPEDGDIINFWFYVDGYQLEPCTEYYVWIWIDFKQEAEECHTYTFTVEMTAVQWNKA